jgi:hypothetical protein
MVLSYSWRGEPYYKDILDRHDLKEYLNWTIIACAYTCACIRRVLKMSDLVESSKKLSMNKRQ